MEENINKSVLMATGLVATLFVATLVAIGVRMTKQIAGMSYTRTGSANQQAAVEEYSQYIGETVSGNEVISLINQWQRCPIKITVKTAGGTSSPINYNNGYIKGSTNLEYIQAHLRTRSDSLYVAPDKKFSVTGKAKRDGTFSEVTFTQQ